MLPFLSFHFLCTMDHFSADLAGEGSQPLDRQGRTELVTQLVTKVSYYGDHMRTRSTAAAPVHPADG